MKLLSLLAFVSVIAVLELARHATTPVAWIATMFLGGFVVIGLVFLGEKMLERR
jgi:hypothetical protein